MDIQSNLAKCDKVILKQKQFIRILEQSLNIVKKLHTDAANSQGKPGEQKLLKRMQVHCRLMEESAQRLVKLTDDLLQILADTRSKLEEYLKPRLPRSARRKMLLANPVVAGAQRTRSTSETGSNTAPGGEDEDDIDVSDPVSADEAEM